MKNCGSVPNPFVSRRETSRSHIVSNKMNPINFIIEGATTIRAKTTLCEEWAKLNVWWGRGASLSWSNFEGLLTKGFFFFKKKNFRSN